MTTAIIDPATLAAQPAAQPAHHPATPPTVTPILQTLHIPALGALWPQQGGVFAGITTDSAGRTVAVIVPPKGVGELGLHKWGSYGREIESARHRTDGHANTQALLASQANGYAHPAAAAILLAASKVDVAGLMELVAKVSNAAYVAGLQDANGEGCDATAQTLFEDELETALRMALAQRGWVGLTDDENIEVLDAVDWYNFPEDLIAETSRRLKEKNA